MTSPFAAGDLPTADEINRLIPLFVRKSAAESVASNTSPQNDNELVLPVTTNATYKLDMLVLTTVAGSVVDMNIDFTFPANCDFSFGVVGPDTTLGSGLSTGTGQFAAVSGDTSSPTATIPLGSGSVGASVFIKGTLVTTDTSGSLQFRWAQFASSATSLFVNPGSYMELARRA
jgi:hypothetical protein